MRTFLLVVASTALAGCLTAFGILVDILVEGGGGNWIGGMAALLGMVVSGGAATVLYLVGLAAASRLRALGEPSFRNLYTRGIPVVLVLIPVALGAKALLGGIESWQEDHHSGAREREAAAEAAMVADPVRLQAYASKHGLETRLPVSEQTPLDAAVSQNHGALVERFLTQGARVTDKTLVTVVEHSDATTCDVVLRHTRFIDGKTVLGYHRGDAVARSVVMAPGALPTGQEAAEKAFMLGRFDLLRRLVQAGVETTDLAATLIGDKQKYMRFFAGETNWPALRALWQAPSCPGKVLESVRAVENESRMSAATFGEKEVVATLNLLLRSDSLYGDPAIGFMSMAIPDWMKGVPHDGWNYSSAIPRINWTILAALYPGLLPTTTRAKGFTELEFLAKEALEKEGEGGKLVLRMAIDERNVEATDMLLREGFRAEHLYADFDYLDSADDRQMKGYLESHGVAFDKPDH